MKIFKWLLVLIAGLAVLLIGGGLLISPTFSVERSTQIAAPADRVYALVEDRVEPA